MNEDKAFNAFLKAKLEEDVAVPEVRCQRHPAIRWPRSFLMAASLVGACAFFAWFVESPDAGASEERCAALTMELLDDSEVLADSDTLAEKLLAWQDAPYEEIANL